MNSSVYKFIPTVSLLLLIFISASNLSGQAYISFSSWNNHSRGADFSNNRSGADYSCNSNWNDGGSHRSSRRGNTFDKDTTVQDFQRHFAQRGFTESEILNQRCLYMFDDFVKFAQTYSSYNSTIKEIHMALKNLTLVQKTCYLLKGTYCAGLQKRIQFLYNELNNSRDMVTPCNAPLWRDVSFEAFQQQLPEYASLKDTYKAYTPLLSQAVGKRLDAYDDIKKNEYMIYASKSYNLNNNVKHLLSQYGHDTARFTECYGNLVHQAVHQESLDILDRIDSLPHNSLLYDHQEALVDLTVAMVDYNHEWTTGKALIIGDLCWTLLDYGQAIAEGAALGVYSAVHDIITNPIEATICIVASKEVLAYQLCKVLYNVADIGFTAITDGDGAKAKWDAYVQPLNSIIDAISKKEITLRDGIKGGTALVVGWKAQGKLLGGLGKFCNTIKQKSLNFIKNSPLLKSQEYLTTPEGLLFKATAQSNKLKQNDQCAASSLKNNINEKIVKNKNIILKQKKGSLIIEQGGKFSESEKKAADYMCNLGNEVILRAPKGTRLEGGTSDLLVNGIAYDVYTPITTNPNRIITAIAAKKDQASGIVLDLSQTSVTIEQLGNIKARLAGKGINNILDIVVLK